MKTLEIIDNDKTILKVYPRFFGYDNIIVSFRYNQVIEEHQAEYVINGNLLQLTFNWLPVYKRPYSVIIYDESEDDRRIVWMGNVTAPKNNNNE